MPQWASPAGRFIAARTLAAWLFASAVFAAGASPTQADPAAPAQSLGSVYEYEQSAPPPSDGYGTSLLGIEVKNQREWFGRSRLLEYGRWVNGVEIVGGGSRQSGRRGWPAGLSPWGLLQTTVLVAGLLAAGFFPPAMMGVMALSKAAETHAMIVAVDGKRTSNVTDFEEAIENAGARRGGVLDRCPPRRTPADSSGIATSMIANRRSAQAAPPPDVITGYKWELYK